MFGYYTAYIIVVLCLLVSFSKDKKLDRLAYVVLAIVLVCLCGFRHVEYIDGNDSYGYYEWFLNIDRIKNLSDEDHMDPTFFILTKCIRVFTSNEYVFGFIIALLTITPVLYLYKKVSPFPLIAVFLYVCMQTGGSSPYFMAFNQMRQALAVSFMCIAVYYYIKNSCHFNKRVIAFLIIMVFTHWTSLLMLIPFLLKKIRIEKYYYIGGMIVAAVAGLFAQRFVPQLSDLFLLLNQGFFIDNDTEFSLVRNIPMLLLSCFVFVISSKDECNSFEHKCLFLTFVLFGVLAPFSNSIFRFCIYYNVIGNLAIASSFYKSFKKKNVISIGVGAITFAYMSYVILVSLAGVEKEYPYSIW